jgi:hypothetical protein
MTTPATPQYFYPNKMGRIILSATRELGGEESFKSILKLAKLEQYIVKLPAGNLENEFPFEHLSAVQEAVENHYGIHEGRDFNRRVGRACLAGGLQEFNPLVGIADLPVRMLPLGLKLHVGFDMFAMVFNRFTDQVVSLGEDERGYRWVIERCPVCWGRKTETPCCDLAVGILQEGLAWATGGKEFLVTQTKCIASGDDACLIEIGKKPMK